MISILLIVLYSNFKTNHIYIINNKCFNYYSENSKTKKIKLSNVFNVKQMYKVYNHFDKTMVFINNCDKYFRKIEMILTLMHVCILSQIQISKINIIKP